MPIYKLLFIIKIYVFAILAAVYNANLLHFAKHFALKIRTALAVEIQNDYFYFLVSSQVGWANVFIAHHFIKASVGWVVKPTTIF